MTGRVMTDAERVGALLAEQLTGLIRSNAKAWGVSVGESSRRMGAMQEHGIHFSLYPIVIEMGSVVADGKGFYKACKRLAKRMRQNGREAKPC